MPVIFDVLPGLEVPVGAIAKSLGEMWSTPAPAGGGPVTNDDAKATQVNFVLHLGFGTTPEDALVQFRTAVRFSQRCPSRIVVLCPMVRETGAKEMRAKIYGECHLGRSKGDKRCVEFVMLNYPLGARLHLEDQVSVCLSTDLPLYYWVHRFTDSSRLADYRYLLSRAKRVLIDSAIAPPDTMTYPWPKPAALRDLVFARLLPIRQTIGQFLSSYPPAALVDGLQEVTLTSGRDLGGEGCVLGSWLAERLNACGAAAPATTIHHRLGLAQVFTLEFRYADPRRYFRWSGSLADGHARFAGDFGGGGTTLPASISLLTPEAALNEAMFF